jgi:protein-S-isoprenylcysteine O-methyltransferase Ste14
MPEPVRAALWLVYLCWAGWAVLWLVLSRATKRVARTESRLSRLLHVGPMLAAAMLLSLGRQAPWPLAAAVLPRAAWLVFAGAVLVLAGLAFAIWARLTIAGNWSGVVTVKQDHALIVTGPYRLVRHPIYTGLLAALFGTFLVIDASSALLAFGIVLLAFLRKMRTEERFMAETFGAAYAVYHARTPALLPGL